jgi:predicted Zn-ribbon and HTH transcriptional regulator
MCLSKKIVNKIIGDSKSKSMLQPNTCRMCGREYPNRSNTNSNDYCKTCLTKRERVFRKAEKDIQKLNR